MYIYIYTFFIIQTRFFTYYLFTICTRCRVARGELESGGGGYTDHHAIYLSIYPLSIRDSVFRLSFFEQERKGSETTNGRRVRAIPVRRNGFARVLTLRNVRSLGVFAVGGKRVGKGEGERRTRERSDEKRENAAARVSRKFHYFTLFPSWSTTLFTAFISFSPLHLKSSNIADLSSYNAYTRMIMRMMNAIVRQITMNINFLRALLRYSSALISSPRAWTTWSPV